eukprot:387520_1
MSAFPRLVVSLLFIVLTVFSLPPKCEYFDYEEPYAYFPMDFCVGQVNVEEGTNESFMLSCNQNINRVYRYIWLNNAECSGGLNETVDVTDELVSFNCDLPQCNSSYPLVSVEFKSNCSVEEYEGDDTYIANSCVYINKTASSMISCTDDPPSMTITMFMNDECTSNDKSEDTYTIGCNHNGTEDEVLVTKIDCTVPTNKIHPSKSSNLP